MFSGHPIPSVRTCLFVSLEGSVGMRAYPDLVALGWGLRVCGC